MTKLGPFLQNRVVQKMKKKKNRRYQKMSSVKCVHLINPKFLQEHGYSKNQIVF